MKGDKSITNIYFFAAFFQLRRWNAARMAVWSANRRFSAPPFTPNGEPMRREPVRRWVACVSSVHKNWSTWKSIACLNLVVLDGGICVTSRHAQCDKQASSTLLPLLLLLLLLTSRRQKRSILYQQRSCKNQSIPTYKCASKMLFFSPDNWDVNQRQWPLNIQQKVLSNNQTFFSAVV